jgi:hypothetical protein
MNTTNYKDHISTWTQPTMKDLPAEMEISSKDHTLKISSTVTAHLLIWLRTQRSFQATEEIISTLSPRISILVGTSLIETKALTLMSTNKNSLKRMTTLTSLIN